jgi:HAD superfamily phosphoserine phosphatase-like hydrolase
MLEGPVVIPSLYNQAMIIKAIIIDFDGTIVRADTSDVLAGLVGKQAESEALNQRFHEGKMTGVEGLVQRINFLKGLSIGQMREVVAGQDYLRPGARELFDFLRANHIVSIIASGSTLPFLRIYQEKLGADYVVGSNPKIEDGRIVAISESDYSGLDFKIRDSKAILDHLGIPGSQVAAIGDSPADRAIFEFAAKSIAINPKAGIEQHADYVIHDDLAQAIPILRELMGAEN